MTTGEERRPERAHEHRVQRARSADAGATQPRSAKAGAIRHDDGKRALFSSAVRRPGTLVVECSRCHGRTRVAYLDFAQHHLPYWVWTPWRKYSRYMSCPACGQRAWVSARWFE